MTPHTLALEACRLLVESYCEHTPAWELRKLHEAREKARQALASTQQDDTRTLNIGGGR